MANNGRSIFGTGQISTNGIEQRLYTFIFERRATKHGNDRHTQSSFSQSSTYFAFGNGRGIIEIFLHDDIITFCDFFEHLIAPFLCLAFERCGNLFYRVVCTHGFIMPINSLHRNKVYNTFEGFFCANRYLHRARICTQYIFQLAHHFKEVRTRTVHFIYITDTGNIIFISLSPYGLRLGFYTTHSTECRHSTVENT